MNHCKKCGNNIPDETETCEEAGFGEGCGNTLPTLKDKSCAFLYSLAKQGNDEARTLLTERWGGKYPDNVGSAENCQCCRPSEKNCLLARK